MNNELIKNNDTSIRLCSGQNCCPTLRLMDKNTVEITDDTGNTVYMSIEQAKLITKALSELGV